MQGALLALAAGHHRKRKSVMSMKSRKWLAVCLLTMLTGACGEASEGEWESLDAVEQGVLVGVPARIQAEAYERFNETTPATNAGGQCDRGDGVDKETTSDFTGGSCNIGWTAAGEWLEYDLTASADALYTLSLRLAADATGRTVHAELDGVNLGPLSSPSAGWQDFSDRAYTNVRIKPGNHVLRVVFDTGNVNFNYFDLVANAPTCSDQIKNGSETGVDCGGSCAPCATSCVSQLLVPVAAISSSNETAQYTADKAIDGNVTTRWSSSFTDPQWLYLDLGVRRKLDRVVLNWEAAASLDYDIQVADDSAGPWTTVYNTTAGNGGIDDLAGLNAVGRHVRMYSRRRATPWGNSLFELAAYGDPNPNCSSTPTPTCTDGIKNGSETGIDCGGSCPACPSTCVEQVLAPSGAQASSTENAMFPPGNVIDSNSSTRWSSSFADPQWIYVDLGAPRHVSRVRLDWEAAASANYDVQVSNSSAGPWTNLFTSAAGNGGLDDIGALNGTGRYVRMYSRARTTPYGNSLFDFVVLGDPNPNCSGPTGQDTDGDRLPDSAETNTGVFVGLGNTGTSASNPDTDADGIPDGDEVLGSTAGLNLPAMGLNPLRKNILLEYDWFTDALDCAQHSHRPNQVLLDRVSTAFASAPVPNPDGTTGITLIHDFGQGGAFTGGNFIDDADGVVDGFGSEYNAYKAANFAANRLGYFHYVIMPHQYNDRSNFSSGLAFIIGSDMIVSLQCYNDNDGVGNTIMHELGHNLGLQHGGFEYVNYKPNYNSVMNYNYQFPGVDNDCTPPGDGVLDYSRNQRITLDESALNESNGICNGVDWDWNFNGNIESNVSWDLNGDVVLQPLSDYDDWSNLVYDFSPGTGAGAAPHRLSAPQVAVCDNPPPKP
jgi:hypothetical protein